MAGVAPVTVSRVINNAENVKRATREKVMQAIESLGYVPSGVAQSLRSKRTRSLALLVPDITNIFWPTVARGVEDAAQSRGYSILLCNTDEDIVKQNRYLDVVVGQRVDGVIIAPRNSEAQHLTKLRQHKIPTVVIDRHIKGWDVDSVRCDSIAGSKALVEHLVQLGHKRIAIVTGPKNTSTSQERVAGYRLALNEAGLPIDERLIRHGEFRSESKVRMMEELLTKDLRPTAIFTANNVIMMRVFDALTAAGIRIPQDMALVCFDDLPNISRVFPFFTVTDQPAYEMGVNAAQLLLSRLDAEVALKPRHVILPARLIVRHSCGSHMAENDNCSLSLPLPQTGEMSSRLISPLEPEELQEVGVGALGGSQVSLAAAARTSYDFPDDNKLFQALRHLRPAGLSSLAVGVMPSAWYEYILERRPEYVEGSAKTGGGTITPEDQVEFARRIGLDALVCDFNRQPIQKLSSETDLHRLEPPPLYEQLNLLERYFRAAQAGGVGIVAGFPSFFQQALQVVGLTKDGWILAKQLPLLEKAMDLLLHRQLLVMQSVCDRFGPDLVGIMISEDFDKASGVLPEADRFVKIVASRMRQLIAPAREYGRPIILRSGGDPVPFLPLLLDLGFDAVYPVDIKSEGILALTVQLQERLICIGNILPGTIGGWSREQLEEFIRKYCTGLARSGAGAVAVAAAAREDTAPEDFLAVIQMLQKYGR